MAFDTDILAQLRSRRRIIGEILVVAVLLGLFLNVFSNLLYDSLTREKEVLLGLNVQIWAVSFLAFVAAVIWYFTRKKGNYELRFRILLPIANKKEGLSILPIPGYAPSQKANPILKTVLKQYPDEEDAIARQLGLDGGKVGPGEGFRFESIEKTIDALFVAMLKLHSEHTQTDLGRYHVKYADYCQRLATKSIDLDHEALFGCALPGMPRRINLPRHISFQFAGPAKQPDTITLNSPYASLKITILPYWTIITQNKSPKTYLIATRNLSEKAVLLAVPIKVAVSVRYRALLNSKAADDYCDWMELLLNKIWQWLAWEHYVDGDQERLLVELCQIVKKGSQ